MAAAGNPGLGEYDVSELKPWRREPRSSLSGLSAAKRYRWRTKKVDGWKVAWSDGYNAGGEVWVTGFYMTDGSIFVPQRPGPSIGERQLGTITPKDPATSFMASLGLSHVRHWMRKTLAASGVAWPVDAPPL